MNLGFGRYLVALLLVVGGVAFGSACGEATQIEDAAHHADVEDAARVSGNVGDETGECILEREGVWSEYPVLGGGTALCRVVEADADPPWTDASAPCPYCAYECRLSSGCGALVTCKYWDDGKMSCSAESETPSIERADCVAAPGQLCCAGHTNGCSSDGWSVIGCKTDGLGWEQVECISEHGTALRCMELPDSKTGEMVAYCPSCIPGMRKCAVGEDAVIQCDSWGVNWVLFEKCTAQDKCVLEKCTSHWEFEK